MSEQGPTEKQLVEVSFRARMPLPPAIQNAPVLFQGLELYLVAFLDLTTERQVTMGGVAPIPWTAIDRYCMANEIEGEQREDLFFFVRRLDQETLKPKPAGPKIELPDGPLRK